MKEQLDGGYSWLVVLGSFISQFIVMGIHQVFGVLYIDLLQEFGENKATTAWIGSISFGVMVIIGPITTTICNRLGCRAVAVMGGVFCCIGLILTSYVDSIYKMYVTYSVLFSLGTSFCYYTSILILEEYFSSRLVLANGIALSGAGVGTVSLAPAMKLLLDNFTWRDALRILSSACLGLVFSGVLYSVVKAPTRETKRDTEQTCMDLTVFRNKAYIVWIVVVSLVLFGYYTPYVHLVRHCQDLSISKLDGSVLVGYIAISQTLGKIFFGRVANHPRVNRVYLFQVCLLLCSVLTTLLPVLTSYTALVLYCWLFGFFDGCFVLLLAILTGDIVGRERFAWAFGLFYSITGLAMILGPPVAGWIYEVSQSYNPAFFMAGACTTTGVCLMFLVPRLLPPEVKDDWDNRAHPQHCKNEYRYSSSSPETFSDVSSQIKTSFECYANSKDVLCKQKNHTNHCEKACLVKSSSSAAELLHRYFSVHVLTDQKDNFVTDTSDTLAELLISLPQSVLDRETDV